MRYSKVLLLVLSLSTTMCSRYVQTIGGNTTTQSLTDSCSSATASIRPLTFSGNSITQGAEVLWQVQASGCSTGFRLIRPDNTTIVSFSTLAHFTKRYTSAANIQQEIIIVQPVLAGGVLGNEISVESKQFSVFSNGSNGGIGSNGNGPVDPNDPNGGGLNVAFECTAYPDYSNINAVRNSSGTWLPSAPVVSFTVATNRKARLVASGDAVDTTVFTAGVPSSSAASLFRVSGQLQKAGLNVVMFKAISETDPTQNVSCMAPVTVNAIAPPPPPPLTCSAFSQPSTIIVPVNAYGQPTGASSSFQVQANRLANLIGVRQNGMPQIFSPTSSSVTHSVAVGVNSVGPNLVEFQIADAVDGSKTASCSGYVWVYGLLPNSLPTCTISGPDLIAPGMAASLQLTAGGPVQTGSIEGIGTLLPGSGIVAMFPSATTTYVGRVTSFTGTGTCTKTVQVIAAPTCSLIPSANPIKPGQSVSMRVHTTGAISAIEINRSGAITPVSVTNPVAVFYPERTEEFVAKVTGPGGVASCPLTLTVDPVTVGVNFEDGSDWDLNDANLCMSGYFNTTGSSIISAQHQTVRASFTKLSACDDDMTVRVYNANGAITQSFAFRASSQPVLDLVFEPGSRLYMHWIPRNMCSKIGPQDLTSAPRVQINSFCRNTGN
jgi:hypothetical protein